MSDHYYAFPDQATMYVQLEPLGMVQEGQVVQANHQYATWQVGLIAPDPTAWHLNVRLIDEDFDLSSLEPWAVYPPNPICVWA